MNRRDRNYRDYTFRDFSRPTTEIASRAMKLVICVLEHAIWCPPGRYRIDAFTFGFLTASRFGEIAHSRRPEIDLTYRVSS